MRWIMGKETEMERPEYRFCQCCGEKVGREKKGLPCLRKINGKKLKDDRNGRTAGGGQ